MNTSFRISAIAVAVAAASGCASLDQREPIRVVGHQAVHHGVASDAEAQYALGKYYLGQDRAALALIAFTRAIDHDPGHVEAHNGRATALVQLGDLERAGQDLARAIELSPDSAHLLSNQGYVRIRQHDFVGAAESLRRAFELEPRNPRVLANWRMLAAAVSRDPELAHRLKSPMAGGEPGLAELPKPLPTPSVVRSLSAVLSGPVINLDPSRPAVSPAAPAASAVAAVTAPDARAAARAATTSVVDLERRAPVTEAARPAAVVTVPPPEPVAASTAVAASPAVGASPAGAASSATVAFAVPETAPAVAPAQLSVLNVQAAAGVGTEPPQRALAPVAAGPVVDVAAVVRSARIEVSNGNGVRGMAARVGRQLGAQDYRVARITNAASFDHGRTRIYFRDGFQQAALQLGRTLATRPAVMLDNALSPRTDVRVVIGRDLIEGAPTAAGERPLEVATLDDEETASAATR